MTSNTAQKILKYIQDKQQASATELSDYLGISWQGTYKQLKKLVEKEKLAKIGKAPKVFYVLKTTKPKIIITALPQEQSKIIETRYLNITADGKIHNGIEGFSYWCTKTNQPFKKTAVEYIQTLEKYDAYKTADNIINGLEKITKTFDSVYLDLLFYLDFYSIERFGKTKLGQMLLYAKQSQNKQLMKNLIIDIKPKVNKIIKKYRIDVVGFIPPTVKREVQFIHVLQRQLQIKKDILSIEKIINDVAVPQKSLTKKEDRIENAKQTIYVTDKRKFTNILLIDDAVGSGATLNETAKKIRKQKLCTGKIIGLAITGSFKGFDIISEV
ncbi:MAG: hypothetical protein A2233_03465 [Candidatus Kerfeldbacteria bacterium RIFOXYA2_FULL_38_24]|uniref:Helix-turn-helix type 11 domain-containing protein n=1 Tax=Candidatus Kerfeldbacteria bacterium RIFOXYB2_FULL_38_14 TaxID=1798547 RepID=A0A1G2BE17_9BACT|nr:MAG: hypothetical protein A2233_03465 [Candidatus Kerfeldbacteria bacterium RIFOXYA2_FULL_38_24]OGY87493.1 MAG: hypothetical protein A2319_03960 [Candidatus Kerfeldbacteria bacterium RIFOXYB2_FULL_38_14]OGY90229.1 MAG: hypothetical protein A2458_03650 [Candidatus Kerfeldbacteria bacterium RIFOXYC2_FULL_38_9]